MDLIEIDDILLILQRIDSPVSLVRTASTCKRWHGIISDAGFLRRFRSVHTPSQPRRRRLLQRHQPDWSKTKICPHHILLNRCSPLLPRLPIRCL
ncbi:unnamed protein product [Urochloa humidicola]